MTTNCNDTCDAVDKLLLFYSVQKQMDMWGSIPSSFFFFLQYHNNYPFSENRNGFRNIRIFFFFSIFFVKASSLRETLRGHLLLNA